MRGRAGWFVAAILTSALAGCASTGTGEAGAGAAGGQQGVTIRVENNQPGGSTITVSVVPDVGVRRTLGQIPAGETRDFAYEGMRGGYHLIALRDIGGELRSESFRLFANSLVRWNLSTNNVTVSGR